MVCACASAPLRVPQTPRALDAHALEGTWHVVASTFPMWLDGSRRGPTFNYSGVAERAGRVTMDDRVSYSSARGALEHLDGVDVQHPQVPTHFTWSGRGFLAAFTSEWDVVSLDAQGRYAIITFSPTLATPAGLDVISREATLSDEAWGAAKREVEATPELAALARGLARLETPATAR